MDMPTPDEVPGDLKLALNIDAPREAKPRQSFTTRSRMRAPSDTLIGVPGRPPRFAPYTDVMNDARETVIVNCPDGSSEKANRPASSVIAPRLGRRPVPASTTTARRTGCAGVSSLTTIPDTEAVPVVGGSTASRAGGACCCEANVMLALINTAAHFI